MFKVLDGKWLNKKVKGDLVCDSSDQKWESIGNVMESHIGISGFFFLLGLLPIVNVLVFFFEM